MKAIILLFITTVSVVCFGLLPKVHAINPPPDGGYPGRNTAEGQNALLSLTTGGFNTAVGYFSLRGNDTGSFNTAVGAGALLANTSVNNTATGAGALLSNVIGGDKTANGALAVFSNISGTNNTANGSSALRSNTTGSHNTANGFDTLGVNSTGGDNTATGFLALLTNSTGDNNTANGASALTINSSGFNNTALGATALAGNTTGFNNLALGFNAGSNQTTGSNNVYIGANVSGVAGESNACYIRGIFGAISANGMPVLVNLDNKLGTTTSSKRFKSDIKPMAKASETPFALKPVTFRYKKEIDAVGTSQFGLVAEEVEKVNSDLVVRDKEGKPYSVRYDQVNAMLLNEFLKEHHKVEEQQATMTQLISDSATQDATIAQLKSTMAQQQKGMEVVIRRLEEEAAQIQKVSDQVELSKAWPRVVSSNQR